MKKNKNKEKQVKRSIEASLALRSQPQDKIHSDINGSYTGTPVDGSRPEQDSDDL